jgi:diketogulonate reductase-like aldo/keto reductase
MGKEQHMAQIQNVKLANGTEMPMQGFGVFQIPAGETERVVLDAISTGYRLLDTAYSYQNEAEVGRAVQTAIADGLVRREELFITTKAYIQQMGYEKTLAAFYESLRKLHLDYLDLYLIHMPFGDYYGSWRALEELYAQGLIRAIGVCNFDSARLIDLCYNVKIRPMVDQIERHPHYQRWEELKRYAGAWRSAGGLGSVCRRLKGDVSGAGPESACRKAWKNTGTGHSEVGHSERHRGHPQIDAQGTDERKRGNLGF